MSSVGLRLPFVVFANGERFPMLIGENGQPQWYPTLFITIRVRNASKAPNTMRAVLASVRYLLAWASWRSIDLETRFARKEFLNEEELESLCAYSRSSEIYSEHFHIRKRKPVQ